MKEILQNSLSFNDKAFQLPIKVYETAEEADKAAGKVGACVDEANKNLVYRSVLPEGRSLIVDVVQELTKVPFIMVDSGEKDDKGQPILERDTKKDGDADYVKRALAATPAVTFDMVQAEVTKQARGYTYTGEDGKPVVVPALAVDIKQTERQPRKPAKLAQKWQDAATMFLTGKKNIQKFGAAYTKSTGKPFAFTKTGDTAKDTTTLGWLCKEYADAQDAFANV